MEEARSLAQRTNGNEKKMESDYLLRSQGLLCLQEVIWGQDSKAVNDTGFLSSLL